MKNTFTVKYGQTEITAHNTVTNAFSHWLRGFPYAAYIRLISGEHVLNIPAELSSYNADVSKGQLYATYMASFLSDEFPYTVEKIGFCPNEAEMLSNECNLVFEPSGVTEIRGTVYLAHDGAFAFLGGDNAFVKSLLGIIEPDFNLRVYGGSSSLPSASFADISGYSELESDLNLDSDCSIAFDAGEFSDFVVVNDSPVARFNAARNITEIGSEVFTSDCGFVVSGAEGVTSVFGNGYANYNCAQLQGGMEWYADLEERDFSGYTLICDPCRNHAAAINGSRCVILDKYPTLREFDYTGDLTLCSDGTPVSVSSGKIAFYKQGNNFTVQVYDGQTVVLSNDGYYNVFVYSGSILYIYAVYTTGEVSLLSSHEVGEMGTLSRLSSVAVGVLTQDVQVFTEEGAVECYELVQGLNDYSIEDGYFYRDGTAGNFISGQSMDCEKYSNGFCISNGVVYRLNEDEIRDVFENLSFDSMAAAGGKVFCLKDGKLSCYMCGSYGIYVSCAEIGDVTCDVMRTRQCGRLRLKITDEEV